MSQELKGFSENLKQNANDELSKRTLNDLILNDNRFYLEGFRCLFSKNGENLKWMLDYIEKIENRNGVNMKRVEFWPKIKSSKITEKNGELKQTIYPSLNYKELIENTPVGLVSIQIVNDSTNVKLYSDIIKIIEVKMSCITTTLTVLESLTKMNPENILLPSLEFIAKDDEFLYKGEHFLFPDNLVENDELKVDFWQSYQVHKADYKSDILKSDEIDSKIARLYFEKDNLDPKAEYYAEFNQLKELMKINITWDGSKYIRRIESKQIEINEIRDRLVRLDDLRKIQDYKKDEIENNEEAWKRLEIFIEPETNIFEKIDKILAENKTVYIHGIPGCGKTTLAREYALYRKSMHLDLSSLAFINSRSFQDNVYELKERFLKSRDDLVKLEEMLPLIELTLSKSKKEIFFIFDDIKDLEEVIEIMVLINPRHKIMLTSRNSDIESIISDDAIIELKSFNREKCKEYFIRNGIELSNRNVEKFLEKEKDFPVQNIELFAKQLKNNLIDFQEANFNENRSEQIKYIMDQINKQDSLALEILKHLCYLNGQNIEFELIEEVFFNESETNLRKSLDFLIKIGYMKEIGNQCYEMTNQIQNDVYSILGNNEIEFRLKVIQTLTRIIMKNKNINFKILFEKVKKIYNHAEKLTLDDKKEFQIDNSNAKLIKKLKVIIDYCYYKMEKSIEMADKVIKIIKKYCTLKIKTCEMRQTKGQLLHRLGKYDAALEIFRENLEIQKNYYFDENNKEIGETYENMGTVYYSKGEYDKAIEYFNKSYEIFKKVLPENHPYLALYFSKIGSVYSLKGNYNEALDYFFKSLEMKKKFFSKNHPDIASSYQDIGSLCLKKSDYNESFQYFIESLEIFNKFLPENHPLILASLNNIGSVLKLIGQYDTALEYYFKVLQFRREVLPESHSDIALTLSNIGTVFDEKGEYDNALEYYFKSLKIKEHALPDNHPDIAKNLINIGSVYKLKGEYEKAFEYFFKSLDILNKVLPKNHPYIATNLNNIGSVYKSKGEYDKAIDYYNKCLNIEKVSLPENHPDIATSYNNIGSLYLSKGEYDKAIDYYNKCLNIEKVSLPENHPDIATSYNNIGSVYNSKKEYDKALEYYSKALEMKKIFLPEIHPDIGSIYYNIGLVLISKGAYEKALEYLVKSLEVLRQVLPENHPTILLVSSNIQNLCDFFN